MDCTLCVQRPMAVDTSVSVWWDFNASVVEK